jgi:hypothetical protein
MKHNIGLFIFLGLLASFMAQVSDAVGGQKMKVLKIRWQRLVDEKGQTCDRCGTTETAIEDAVQKLKRSLNQLQIDVVLEKSAISFSTFSKDTLQSNRIWVADKPIEEWLSATIGQSKCCSTCQDSDCRTITVDGKTYEDIPAELIVKAGLLAGAQLFHGEPQSTCCPPEELPKEKQRCCPESTQSEKK